MALIIGNGVGGRLYMRVGKILVEVPGGFEPGHFLLSRGDLELTGLISLLPNGEIKCGCDTKGTKETRLCFESVVKGPAIEEIFNAYVALVKQRRELPSSPLLGMESITNEQVGSILRETSGQDPVCQEVLRRVGSLFAYRLEELQRRADNRGPISFALIGGVGVNLGPWLTTYMEAASAQMRKGKKVPKWEQRPTYLTGAFPSNETNLRGNIIYMLSHDTQTSS